MGGREPNCPLLPQDRVVFTKTHSGARQVQNAPTQLQPISATSYLTFLQISHLKNGTAHNSTEFRVFLGGLNMIMLIKKLTQSSVGMAQ